MWILKKKQQQEKIKKLKEGSITTGWNIPSKEKNIVSKEITNPKWHSYSRSFGMRKIMCAYTNLREDPDWYRLIGKSNSSEYDFVYNGLSKQLRRWKNKTKV